MDHSSLRKPLAVCAALIHSAILTFAEASLVVVKSFIRRSFSVLTRVLAVGAACIFVLSSAHNAANAGPFIIDFDNAVSPVLVNGDVVSALDPYLPQIPGAPTGLGVKITADNNWASDTSFTGNDDFAVAFDTRVTTTQDSDLLEPFLDPLATSLLAAGDKNPGLILIIQETQPQEGELDSAAALAGCAPSTNRCSFPDDEGRRPPGTMTFEFFTGGTTATAVTLFGIDIYDIDNTTNGESDGKVEFFDIFGVEIAGSEITMPQIGNHATGRLAFNGTTGISGVQKLVVSPAGSFGSDRLIGAPIPEPSTMLLLASGLAGLAAWRRKKAA